MEDTTEGDSDSDDGAKSDDEEEGDEDIADLLENYQESEEVGFINQSTFYQNLSLLIPNM